MKKILITFGLVLGLSSVSFAQTTLMGGEPFSIQLPEKYVRTIGTNNYASAQWEHEEKDFYGYVIVENLDEYKIAELDTSLQSTMDLAIEDLKDFKDFKILDTKTFTTDKGKSSLETKVSYFDEEEEIMIYYQINVYQSKNFIYKVYHYGSAQGFKSSAEDIEYITKKFTIPS